MLALLLCLLAPGCREAEPRQFQVFCAASLSKAVQETAQSEGLPAVLHSGGSSALVRQASLGATADLLLLADDSQAKAALVPKGYTLRSLASNGLVVIAPKSASIPAGLAFEQALAGASQLAVADPQTAPLGSYTSESLKGLALKAKLVPLQDATAVLSMVALGHSDFGIVYRSDAKDEPQVQQVCAVPIERHRPVVYVAVLPPNPPAESQRLVDSLLQGKGREILARHGLLPPPSQ